MSEFKKRFQRWMNGEKVYEAGKILPEVIVTADDPIKKLVEDVNARSNADFVNRVKDPNRTWIQDWENKNKIATHKLSWAEDNGKVIVFPEVQNINGKLHDFTDPKYNHGKWDALDSAIERGDTLLMTPELAKMYTENYKKYYPKGKTFDCGKPVDGDDVRGYDTENKIDVQKEINWMRNWLNARRDILEKNADAVGYGYSKYTPKNTTGDVREAGWNVERYGNPWNPFTYFNNSTPSRNRVNKLIYSQIENSENTPKTSVGHGLSSDYNMRGVYVLPDYWDNGGNYIAFAGIPDSGVKIHELTHASHPLQQEYYILDNVFNGRVPQVVPNHKRSDLDNAKELYGALQQFRYENKLDPKYKVTQEWINKNRDLFKGTYLENIKDSDKLKLFNDVAQNNINTKRLYYADSGKSIKPLKKYDGGTDDKTYLPEYEYEATVTPQGTSLEKHKRITNEEDWLKYWGNVGAGYVNKAREAVAVPTLKALKEFTYFTPIGAATSLGDAIAAHMNGGSPEEILSATVGTLPEVRFANNVGRFARYTNVADDMTLINPELLQMLQEGDFVTKRRFGSTILGKIGDVLRNYKTFLRLGYANAKRQLLGTAVKNRKILPKQVQKIVDDLIDNQHLKEYWSGPFVFNQPEYRWGDMTSLAYFNMSPKDVMERAMHDMNDIPVGNRFLVNSLSTDSYPLVVHMLDSKISPNFRLNPVTDRIVLNGMGNLHGQAAVDRINKKLQLLEMLRGMSLGRAKRYVSPIGEEQITAPFLTAERLYDKGKSIHINPANKGKFDATKKRTGKTTELLAHSKNPLTRKRAIFALNSRKFKH